MLPPTTAINFRPAHFKQRFGNKETEVVTGILDAVMHEVEGGGGEVIGNGVGEEEVEEQMLR